MKTCQCGKEHNKPGAFCSRSCANRRVPTEESNKKRSIALKGRTHPETFDKESQARKTSETRLRKYLETPFEQLGMVNKRRRVFEEQDHKCARCGIDAWQGLPINLELEHKDGNHCNNSRDNLEGLCPNCHSITATWRGRNKTSQRNAVSDEELSRHLQGASSIRQGLLAAGLTPKGNNYNRVKGLKT